MPKVRGRVLAPLRAFVKETFGEAGWNRLLGELPSEACAVLDGLLVPDGWYDRSVHRAIGETTYRLWSGEMPDLGRRMGVRAARGHDRVYLRPLMKIGGPHLLLKRAAAIYRDNFQGGEMSVIERRDDGGRILLDDPNSYRHYCSEALPGFFEELIRLTGREPVHVLHDVCRHQGADHCEFDIAWK